MDTSGMTLMLMRLNGFVLLARLKTVLKALQTLSVMNVKKVNCSKLTSLNVLTTLTALFLPIFSQRDLRKEMESGFALNVILDNITSKTIEAKKQDVSHVLILLTKTAEHAESSMKTSFASVALLDSSSTMMVTVKFPQSPTALLLTQETPENASNVFLSSLLILPELPVFHVMIPIFLKEF